jgi:OOP family OmpA-OmpF porin
MLQPKKWWIGAPFVAGLVYFAANGRAPEVEAELARQMVGKVTEYQGAVDDPKIAVEGRDAVLSGVALDEELKRELLSQLRNAPGVRDVKDATAALSVAAPFTLSIERRGRKIVVGGHVPSRSAREKLKTSLASLGSDLSDSAALAAGAPNDFPSLVEFAATQLARLDPGKATLANNRLTLEGEAKTASDYDGIFAAAKSAPAGIVVAALDISPPRVSPYVWSAASVGEMVALTGSIPSNDIRGRIVAKAAVAGGAVSDSTQVGAGAPAGDFEAAVSFALSELAKLSHGKAALVDSKLSIEGQGRENVAKATIEADAKAGLPQGFELAKLDVEPGPISPYLFSARRTGDSVTISGYAPDESQKDKILGAARRQFGAASIVDQLTIAKGAPQNYADAAVASLRALARLERGKLDFAGAKISLDGVAYHPKAASDVETKFAAALPQNFAADARVMGRTPGSNLSPEQCQTSLSDIVSKAKVQFDSNDSIDEDSTPLLDAIAAIVLRCQDSGIEVGGYTDSLGIAEVNRDVSKRRAQAVVDHLLGAGADSSKLSAVGHGGERPIAASDSDENRARNRRIEFLVKKPL